LVELFSFLGDSCTLIYVGEESWWTDVPSLQTKWPCVKYSDVKEGQFDRILEVTLCPSLRQLAPCIWILRKTPLFLDMEGCVVPYPMVKRDLTGIAETWVQEELTTSDDIQYIELITRKPVRRVPFLWSAVAIEAFRQETQPPIWQQTHVPGEYTIHICETNTSSASSCLIPLCIYKEGLSSHKLTVHNAEALKDSEYFRKNLWENLMDSPMDMFVGRQRIVEIPRQKNTLIVAHSRFTTLRPYHLDALWCGIPLVHNSTLLQGLHADVDRGYYPSNDIVSGVEAANRLISKWISQTELFQIRKNILHRFGILNESLRQRWKAVCHADIQRPVPVTTLKTKTLRIGFSDMWSMFNPSYNFFTLLLESTFPNYTIEVSDTPDLLIFGPFGSTWKNYSIPKIHYTGENSPPIRRHDIVLNMGYERRDDAYIRLPLWILEIDWFGADPVKIQNPVPIPIEPVVAETREKFCAFVVSNPCQPIRNRIFHALSIYKDVDSAGRLYNTLGSSLFAGEGGGGGERAKVDFLRKYKFCIAYENASSPGYVTEKLFHAKAAGCVPIYWGAPDAELDFNMEGVIDARGKTEDEVVALVRKVDENPDLWLKMANTPLLRDDQKPLLTKVAHAILAASTSVQTTDTVKINAIQEGPSLANTVFVTGCNSKFIDTLLRYWLPPIEAQRVASTNVQIHVYLMHDVTDEERARVTKAFPFTRLFDFPTDQFFPDCWNPQHFLWKLWILRKSGQTVPAGYPVVYLDTGVFFCRWPQGWLAKVKKEGLCFLEDPNHDNRNMCSKEFCKKMKVTEEELNDLQLWAGGISFLAGHPSTRIFEEAWTWGLDPEVITGSKWMGVDARNKPIGHRHDQSILSILSRRHGSPRYPLYDVYCGISVRHTYLKGLSLYVHRGFFVVNDPIAMGVHTTWIINLDRRADRMVRGKFSEKALRFPAIDGRTLKLTPDLVRMFSSSKMNWRKGVMACALSHISLWMKLCADKPDIQTYLILEDDAVLHPDCIPLLNAVHERGLPDDWDILYLGGILPPNKQGFESVVEPVNEYIGRIKENTLFSETPTRYFHFCAYSYILRRKAAEKLCARLKKTGCWAPADHLLCNSHDELNIYCTIPLVAGCYQDSDPRYTVSNFNVFGKEEYDSDLRNEDVFTQEEVLAATRPGEFSLERALGQAVVKAEAVKTETVVKAEAVKGQVTRYPIIFHDMSGLFEQSWLEELLGQKISEVQTEIPIFLYQRPYCEQIKKTLAGWPEFTLLHLSDEDGQDPIDIYDWPSCKGVIRNYMKKGLPNKVVTIPLGYHWAGPTENKGRDLFWSFIGAEHKGRRDSLQQFKGIQPNKCVFQKEWNSPEKCAKEEVVDTLQRSLCVPCPGGVNYETFRIYEALEAGAVPVFVEEPGSAELLAYLKRWLPIATSPDWNTAARVVHGLTTRQELYREYRKSLLVGWASLKQWAAKEVKRVLLRSKE
jgi:GR25 family glycosyltransferase involved in LPS biosynthesis